MGLSRRWALVQAVLAERVGAVEGYTGHSGRASERQMPKSDQNKTFMEWYSPRLSRVCMSAA